MIKFKTDFWWQLKHGGNKFRTIDITTTIPPLTYNKYIGKHKNETFGHSNKQLKLETKWGIETTDTKDGQCPYSFLKELFNNGYSLQTQSVSCQGQDEIVNVYNSNIHYSHRTNSLRYTGNVTWSVNNGQTWQKLHDTK